MEPNSIDIKRLDADVKWLKHLHVWGVAIGLPVLAALIARLQRGRR